VIGEYETPPSPDEFEVSVFGPGFGESVVLHPGDGTWLIVDSCIYLDSRESAPLRYLRALGVDVRTQVVLVAATHWHSDHVRGISQVLEAAEDAEFVCSVALHSREFLALLAAEQTDSFLRSPGLAELSRVFAILRERGQSPRWAIADRALWRDVLFALSPSDTAVDRAIRSFAALAPRSGTSKQRVPAGDGNDFTVAMWARTGEDKVLLGADLEEHGRPNDGWSGVLASRARPSGRASVFKVAHHGSADAYHEGVWSQLLTDPVHAVVAPWVLGRGVLPTDEDMDRICAHSPSAHLTAPPQRLGRARHDPRVERLMRESVRFIREADRSPGHVRLRKSKDDLARWEVQHFGQAFRACRSDEDRRSGR
jgi:hypothetical protein